MKFLLIFLIAIAVTACRSDSDDGLGSEGNEIGVYSIPAGSKTSFIHPFDEEQWIGFSSNVSWEEAERLDALTGPDEFLSLCAIDLVRTSDGFGLGSNFGAFTTVEPEPSGSSTFELINNSKEDLKVRVYWKNEWPTKDEMNPVEFDGVRIAILDRPIGDSDCEVSHFGMGEYDGEVFSIISDNGRKLVLSEDALQAVEMPLTGYWRTKYPHSDWYLVMAGSRDLK